VADVPFHNTRIGQRFFEVQLPKLITELARLNNSLEQLTAKLAELASPESSDDATGAPTDQRS
jgi:hypothetical protein